MRWSSPRTGRCGRFCVTNLRRYVLPKKSSSPSPERTGSIPPLFPLSSFTSNPRSARPTNHHTQNRPLTPQSRPACTVFFADAPVDSSAALRLRPQGAVSGLRLRGAVGSLRLRGFLATGASVWSHRLVSTAAYSRSSASSLRGSSAIQTRRRLIGSMEEARPSAEACSVCRMPR